jgi:hypothetical protein
LKDKCRKCGDTPAATTAAEEATCILMKKTGISGHRTTGLGWNNPVKHMKRRTKKRTKTQLSCHGGDNG